jgi:N-acetylglucosaminyl-diphospho-decaprenol L-rhamnosyltransferase
MDDVCVVIVSDESARPSAALATTLAHSGWLDMDAVVVDTGEGRAAAEIEEHFLDVRTIRAPGHGLSQACNLALEAARARYVLFQHPDLEVDEGNLAALVSALDRRPAVALAGSRQLTSDGRLLPSIRRFPSPRHMLAEAVGIDRLPGAGLALGEHELDRRKYEQETACDWTSGFMLVRRTALDNAGWFDERFAHLVGEADLCLRLKRAGWQVVYMPALTVRRREVNRWENARLEARAAYTRMQFARKHFPRTAADYRWALALRYALRVGLCALSRRYRRGNRQAARAALATVLTGQIPFEESSAP